MKVDVVEMFTSEIKAVEINTLADQLTLVIPADMRVVYASRQADGTTEVLITRREPS